MCPVHVVRTKLVNINIDLSGKDQYKERVRMNVLQLV